MARQGPPLARKSSAPWDRLRPVKQDPLESMGYVSKGDTRLLDPRAQESFYHKITGRYMLFCTQNSKDLDRAFASLSIHEGESVPVQQSQELKSTPMPPGTIRPLTPSPLIRSSFPTATKDSHLSTVSEISTELATILSAMRKLREGLLATSSKTISPEFSQRVHVFNIRLAILALHPQSYHPSLLHLLFVLHSAQHPLPRSELSEMTTYMILDLACRQRDLAGAYALRTCCKVRFGYENGDVNVVLASVATGNWITFWRVRRSVDGYVRAILHWHVQSLRRSTLKAIGRAYMGCSVDWILQSTGGGELSWEELVEKETVGWIRQGCTVLIRKSKPKNVETAA